MITGADLDMMARGGSIALLALWSWLLIRDHGKALAARVAVAMCITIMLHLIATIPGPASGDTTHPGRSLIDWIVELGSGTVPPLFWLFSRTWFNDETRLGWKTYALIAPPVLALIVAMALYQAGNALFVPCTIFVRLSWFAFAGNGLWLAWRGREGDLIEGRRRMRTALVWSVGLYVIIINATEMLVHNRLAPDGLRASVEASIVFLTFLLCAAMFAMRQSDMFAPIGKRDEARDEPLKDPALSSLAIRLTQHVEANRCWRDEALTISALAAQLGEQEYRLRRVINGHLGHRNFAAFLNGYRLDEVKEALADPSQRDVPILTIALDAGFGSLGPFNRAFRDAFGMTPSEFRRRP
jgi:AraC-like DNA-binding protein